MKVFELFDLVAGVLVWVVSKFYTSLHFFLEIFSSFPFKGCLQSCRFTHYLAPHQLGCFVVGCLLRGSHFWTNWQQVTYTAELSCNQLKIMWDICVGHKRKMVALFAIVQCSVTRMWHCYNLDYFLQSFVINYFN